MRPSLIFTSVFAVIALGSPIERHEDTVMIERGVDGSAGSDDAIAGPPVVQNSTSGVSMPSSTIADTDATLPPQPVEAFAKPIATRYAQAAVQRHNLHRANHSAPNVIWDAQLAQAAMKSAKRCTFAHFMNENGLQYGQNLALGNPADDIAGIITDQWYSEINAFSGNYGEAQPDYGTNMENFEQWGHFTQVVWKSTTKIGCATWRCKSVASSATDSTPMPAAYGGDVTYCNYQSPGNYGGEYAANIGRPKGEKPVATNFHLNRTLIAKSYSRKTGQKWPAPA